MEEEQEDKIVNKDSSSGRYDQPGFEFTRSRKQYTSDMLEGGLYPTQAPYQGEMPKLKYEEIKQPGLSLFEPYPHEVEPPPAGLSLTRPVTPIDEEVKVAPTQFNKMASYIRRRITAKDDVRHLTIDEQRSLAGILMGEVNGIWPDIRRQVDDPFLSSEKNKELQRRIAVHIVTVCEKLFKHYIRKAQILNKRGIFSGPANMSRLKAQLALDANKFLNVLTIRRYIVDDLRKLARGEILEESKDGQLTQMTFKAMLECSRPKQPKIEQTKTNAQHIAEIEEAMPSLDVTKLYPFLMDLAEEEELSRDNEMVGRKMSRKSLAAQKKASKSHFTSGPRPSTAPGIRTGESLLEDLGLYSKDHLTRDSMYHSVYTDKDTDTDKVTEGQTKLERSTAASKDLEKLVSRTHNTQLMPDEMPALLQAVKPKKKPISAMAEKILKEERELKLQNKTELSDKENKPLHPQPAFTSGKLPNQLPVRTSDVRVSERVCLSSLTLQKHSTLYNDLIDEIDAATVKNLDKNLFLSDEIKEVYREIKKTIPHDYLDMENDPMVEASATYVNLPSALASSSLSRRKKEQVINPKLIQYKSAPWGDQDKKEWSNMPDDPNKERERIELYAPHGQDQSLLNQLKSMTGTLTGITQDGTRHDRQYLAYAEMPAAVLERLSRSYAAWFSWWKNTMNSDDFLKYVSTQESDFLGAIFHLYNEDAVEEETDEEKQAALAKKMEHEKERARYLEEIRLQKSEYTPGFWNANVIKLGGLGHDPEKQVVKVEEKVVEVAPKQLKTIQKINRNQAKLDTEQQEEEERAKAKTAESDVMAIQDRLERVWTALRMPDHHKLDMAIKYSSDEYTVKLNQAIDSWEQATDLILKREQIMSKLEVFERLASDPNRFFEKGQRGSSVKRLEEAKVRSHFYKKLDKIDELVKDSVTVVQDKFQDVISFEGRPYLNKMAWDRTEMLYWLQEQRRTETLQQTINNLPEPLPLPANYLNPGFAM